MAKKKRGQVANIALDVSKQKEFNKKVKRIKPQHVPDDDIKSGVVYISHLPWGFEEKPLREYFTQFGKIVHLRVARSKKTGNPRGYAYIQFAHTEVAKIVAETMNNYLMFGKLIKCQHLLKPHPKTFKDAHRKFTKPKGVEGAIKKHNAKKSEEAISKSQSKMLGKLNKLQAKLAAQGIEYMLEDPKLEEAKAAIKKKAEMRKAELQDKDGKGDDDSDDNDSDDESEEESADAEVPVKASKSTKVQTPKSVRGSNTPVTSGAKKSKSAEKSKRKSLIPTEVDTPKGKMSVLIEDSSEDEITFKTPPMSIKSSKIDTPRNSSVKKTPISRKKTPPKRKLESETKVPSSGAKQGLETPVEKVPAKKAKFLSKSAQKVKTPKQPKMFSVPKSAGKMDTTKVDLKKKKDISTPKSDVRKKIEMKTPERSEVTNTPRLRSARKTPERSEVTNTPRPQSARKTPAKKSLLSESKKKKLKN